MNHGEMTYYPEERMLHGSLPSIMGTRMDALIFCDSASYARSLWTDIADYLDRRHRQLNKFSEESEVAALAGYDEDTELHVSDSLYEILLLCRDYYLRTEKLFDITLKDFGQVRFRGPNRISLDRKGMRLDFGGFAKGYALRHVRTLLREAGIADAFLNFGNSALLGIGRHPCGDCWKVGVSDPYTHATVREFDLKDAALSTSGNTPFHRRHILNPLTGTYCEGKRLSAVLAEDPLDAEILSTVWLIADEAQRDRIRKKFNIMEDHLFNLTAA